ncbi:UDP-N-acetylenolpyruvoylglucosamine reductase, partial [Turicibacter sanguinis]|nr:UDP-N-acetylenolpyruvoylglucosamine reductase [Turicibacter sanguinis]
MFKSFIEEYKGKNIGLLLENEPLSKHTTFRVGGPARCLVIPNSKQSLVETMKLINKYELPFKVIGRG